MVRIGRLLGYVQKIVRTGHEGWQCRRTTSPLPGLPLGAISGCWAPKPDSRLVVAGLLQDRALGRARLLRANLSNRAADPLTQLLEVTFGPETVIGEEFNLANAERILIFGSWADRYRGTPGPPPNDVDVLVVGDLDRADVYEAADRAQTRLGMQVNPVIRTLDQWASDGDSLVLQIKASPTVDVTPITVAS